MADKADGKKVKSGIIADWDAHVTEIFCKICVEEVEAGNKPHGTLTAKGYQNLVEKFAEQTGRPYTQKQLKNRWDSLKSLYDFWLSLEHAIGTGWDSTLQTYKASDEFWENKTKRNKEKRAIRFGPPANLKDLEIMFDKSKVSGLSACIPRQAEPSSPTDPTNADMDDVDGWGGSPKSISPKTTSPKSVRRRKRRGTTPSPNKKRKHPVVNAISKLVDNVISTNSVTSKAVQGDFIRNEVQECIKLAIESGAVEGTDEHYMATKLFIKTENRAAFLTFGSNETRLNWLKRCYEDRK